jgi:hypothetical protein
MTGDFYFFAGIMKEKVTSLCERMCLKLNVKL